MRYKYSDHLLADVYSQVQAARGSRGIVNIAAVAEDVRLRNLDENVALEDIEHLVLQAAQLYGAVMELDSLVSIDMATFSLLPETQHALSGNGSVDTTEDRAIPFGLRQSDQVQ
ncbi:hypothetical protein LHFGNBLO_004673 [Mesorhizobium sp. AR10]|uniref:hypothetical protein n=1 Tax=Mesorhizobium sp. AR10 TaxID=2865839 RepID=UPI0021600979|nr:hypothetical protein [Mesorhizobium sp. AR10]UVK37611.1 hypothetical protein LHFGNBLO_004673 [Mesorhizobium sp. AR10]